MTRKPGDPLVRPFRASAWGVVDANGDTVAKVYGPLDGRDALAQEIATTLQSSAVLPIPMLLYCPQCGSQHVDEPDERTPDWTNPPHRSHLCHNPDCCCIWRPADVPTEGVAAIETRGKADTWTTERGNAESAMRAATPTAPVQDDDAELRSIAADLCRAMRVDVGQITLHWAEQFLREHASRLSPAVRDDDAQLVWLVECPKYHPGGYFALCDCGWAKCGRHWWTKDVHRATKFPTKEAAESARGGDVNCIAVEHQFGLRLSPTPETDQRQQGASLRDRAGRPSDQARSGLGDTATIPSAELTDEQIECRSIKCDDFARYRELWASEIESWHHHSEVRGPVEMAIITLRNDAVYSPWYGGAHHSIHAAVDVLAAEIKRLRNASGTETAK